MPKKKKHVHAVVEDGDSCMCGAKPKNIEAVLASDAPSEWPTDEEIAAEIAARPRTEDQFWLGLRRKVRMYYDMQEMRLQAQGRLLKKSPKNPIELHPKDLVKLANRVAEMELAEKNALSDLEEHLLEVPFYKNVIEPERKGRFKGLGPRMAGVIISSFDIKREDTVSKMWAFAGLAPLTARRCKHCNIVVKETDAADNDGPLYDHPKRIDIRCSFAGRTVSEPDTYHSGKAARPVAGEKLKYNAWLRTKLVGVLGPVLLKVGSPYKKFYDDYKHRKASAGWGVNNAHRHQAAIRYMVKMLLLDIWKAWREHEGLPVRPSYQEEYLGHAHNGGHASGVVPAAEASLEAEMNEAAVNEVVGEELGGASA